MVLCGIRIVTLVDILNIKSQVIECEYPKQLIETIFDRNVVTMKNKPKEEKTETLFEKL